MYKFSLQHLSVCMNFYIFTFILSDESKSSIFLYEVETEFGNAYVSKHSHFNTQSDFTKKGVRLDGLRLADLVRPMNKTSRICTCKVTCK